MTKAQISQRSTLGPFLFLLFIDDLPLASSLKATLFADDTMLNISSISMTILEQKPNLELSKIENWTRRNKLSFNLLKQTICSSKTNRDEEINKIKLKVNDIPLKQSSVVNYLGVYIDDDPSWLAHIEHLLKEVSRSTAFYQNYATKRT